MSSQTFPFENGTTKAHQRIEFKLLSNRSTISSLCVETPAGKNIPARAALPGLGQVWLDLKSPVAAGSSVHVIIDYERLKPPIVAENSVRWGRPTNANLAEVTVTDVREIDFRELFAGMTRELAEAKWKRFIDQERSPRIRKFKEFFKDLDTVTNPDLSFAEWSTEEEKAEKLREVVTGKGLMDGQTMTRIMSIAAGCNTRLSDLENFIDPSLAEALSNRMLPVYQRHFSSDGKTLDQSSIAEAFARFANGELRTGDSLDENAWNCEPDGPAHLNFADHALWSILSGVDADAWATILPCCIAAQEFFIPAYRPAGNAPFLLDRYSPENYRLNNPSRLSVDEIEDALRPYNEIMKSKANGRLAKISSEMDRLLAKALGPEESPGSSAKRTKR